MAEDNVKVVVRCRPFNQKEMSEGAHNIIHVDHDMAQVTIDPPDLHEQKSRQLDPLQSHRVPRTFTYDGAFGDGATNQQIFLESFRPIVHSLTQGYNGCIFCYGQTGSGKTYTMSGVPGDLGCIPSSFQYIFDHIRQAEDTQFLLKASYLEIYNEEIRDLVTNARRLQVRESRQRGVFVRGLSEYMCATLADLQRVMDDGYRNRAVAATRMNAVSSRSHNLFAVRLEQAAVAAGRETIRAGVLHLVDLAGSERQSKTGSTGERLREAAAINLSLSTLGIVIQKLVDGAGHVPYRDSVLTRLLQNSLGGNSKTLMLAAVNPASTNYEESFSTLRYAYQAKRIKNKPKVNEDPKDAQIRQMRDRIRELEQQLQVAMNGGSIQDIHGVLGQPRGPARGEGLQPQAEGLLEEVEEVEDPEEAESLRLLHQQNRTLSQQLRQHEESTAAARITIEEMKNQLQTLKNAVVTGKELQSSNQEREQIIRQTRIKLAERQERELMLKREIARREAAYQQTAGSFQNEAGELEALRAQICQQKERIVAITQDIEMVKKEHRGRVDDLDAGYQALNRKVQLVERLAALFVPPYDLQKVQGALHLDEETGEFEMYSRNDVKAMLAASRGASVVYPRENKVPQAARSQDGAFIRQRADQVLQMEGVEMQTESG